MASPNDLNAAIAVTRFGLGARPGEIATAAADPQGWLRSQIRRAGADQPQEAPETSATRIRAFRVYRTDRRAAAGETRTGEDPVVFPYVSRH